MTDFLPPEHQPDGAREFHDDWIWPFKFVNRKWTSFPIKRPPRLIFGNQLYWSNFETGEVFANLIVKTEALRERFGPKPIPRKGEWQFSMVPTILKGIEIPLPYFAFTLRNGFHFRIGARWTDRTVDSPWTYVTFPSFAFKMIEKEGTLMTLTIRLRRNPGQTTYAKCFLGKVLLPDFFSFSEAYTNDEIRDKILEHLACNGESKFSEIKIAPDLMP